MNTCYDYIESKRMALVIYNYNSMHRKAIPEDSPGIAFVLELISLLLQRGWIRSARGRP